MHTSGAAFEEQVDVQLRGIASQLDNTLRLADDIALQIGANHLIIETFDGIYGYDGEQNYFVEPEKLSNRICTCTYPRHFEGIN